MEELFSISLQYQIFDQNKAFVGTGVILVQADANGVISRAQTIRNTATGQNPVSVIEDIDAGQLAQLIQVAKDAAALLPSMPPAPVPIGL